MAIKQVFTAQDATANSAEIVVNPGAAFSGRIYADGDFGGASGTLRVEINPEETGGTWHFVSSDSLSGSGAGVEGFFDFTVLGARRVRAVWTKASGTAVLDAFMFIPDEALEPTRTNF